jgi:hypothetical protein
MQFLRATFIAMWALLLTEVVCFPSGGPRPDRDTSPFKLEVREPVDKAPTSRHHVVTMFDGAPTSSSVRISSAAAAAAQYIYCTTKADSPLSKHVQVAANQMKWPHAGALCIQNNPGGTRCDHEMTHKSAKIELCGAYFWTITCTSLAHAAEEVIYHCSNRKNGQTRAAGMFLFDPKLRLVIGNA